MASFPSAPDPSGTACAHCGESHPASYTHCPKTGKPLTSGRALIGRVIAGRYRIIGLLGEGGMGAVYVAEHTLIGRKVAIKRLHPELAADEKAVQRFQREARAAAATGHEHIVEILDLGYAEDGAPYLVMEYLRGQSLAALLRKESRITERRACEIVGQVLAALDAVHAQQIVHRDLKPDNIFLTRREGNADYAKILDFGISKVKREEGDTLDLTRTGVMLGTPFYMSPEQARGMKTLDHRVDLYACGIILYECIAGRLPFEGDNYHQLLQAILRQDPPSLLALAPDTDPALEAIILKAVAKDPAARFATASEMLLALLPHGAHLPSPEPSVDVAEPLPTPVPTAFQVTTPVAPELLAERREAAREDNERTSLMDRSDRSRSPVAAGPTPPASIALDVPSDDARERRPAPSRSPVEPRPAIDARGVLGRSPLGRAASQSAAATPLPTGGARYFYAASDDWDEARARLATESAPRVTPSFRDPPSGVRAAGASGRESLGVREPSGSFSTHSSGLREATGSLRDGPRLIAPSDHEPAYGAQGDGSAGRAPVTDPEVKGSLVIAALDHLESVHGAASLGRIRDQLDRDARQRLDGVVLPMAWLPFSMYDQLLRSTERVLGGGDGTTSYALGRATADRELPTTHRLFIQTASPAAAAERIPQIFRLYHARGEARVSATPGAGVRVEIDCGTAESLPYAWVLAGFWHRMLELTGAREVRASVVSCRGRGDAVTAIALRWR